MRQMELDEVHPNTTGRSSERPVSFPDVLLYRSRAGDGEDCLATFDRRHIVVSRPVAGLPCRIRLSISQYQAVAVVARDNNNIIRLMHREIGLSLDLTEIEDFAEAEEYCDRLAAFLDLPALTLAGDKRWDDAMSAVLARVARRKADWARRSRFLAGRQTGAVIAFPQVKGREIIARN